MVKLYPGKVQSKRGDDLQIVLTLHVTDAKREKQ